MARPWLAAIPAALTLCLAWTPARAADRTKAFRGPDEAVTDAHLSPALADDEAAWEKLIFEAYFPGGVEVYWSARFTNLGPGDGKATVKSRVKGGDLGAQESQEKADEGDYTASGPPPRIEIGDHALSGGVERVHVEGAGKGYSFALDFEPTVKPWRPGDGRARFPRGGYYDVTLAVPKGKVTGTITVDGKAQKVEGYGYGMHTHGTLSPHEQAKRWTKLRTLEGDSVVHMAEFVTPDKLGAETVGWLYIAHDGRVVAATSDYEQGYGKFGKDAEGGPGYEVPRTLVLRTEDGGDKVVLAMEGRGRYDRTDELERMSKLERLVVKRFAWPIRYAWKARWRLKTEGEPPVEAEGDEMRFEITHLNP
ncbi:MAG: hypothetical protein ACQEXJ_07490 [Myxococcota bacterium]